MDKLKDLVIITVGTIIIGTAVFFFLMPSHLAVASISGLAIVLHHFIPLSVSALTLILNLICLALGYFLVGKEFTGKTVYASLLMPLVIKVYETILPDFQSIMQDEFLDMICYLFVVSIGLAMLFLRNASSGGIDIIVKILNKYFHVEMGSAMTAAGMVVSVSSIFAYDVKTMVLSVLGTFLNGIVLDHFLFSLNPKKRVCIVSDHFEEVRQCIINDIGGDATIYQATGAYSMKTRPELIAIVDRSAYRKLMNRINVIDPQAFVTVYSVQEVRIRNHSE